MTDRPPQGASVEERLAAIEEKLWPPPPRVRERDIRIDVYQSGHAGLRDSSIRVTHVPTGLTALKTITSRLKGTADAIEELEQKLKDRDWKPKEE